MWPPFSYLETRDPLSAAYKVDYFKRIAGLHLCFLPLAARQNIQVSFEGYAVERHAKVLDQARNVQTIGNFGTLSVNYNGHEAAPAGGALGFERIAKRISSLPEPPRAWITSVNSPFPNGGSGNSIVARPWPSLVPVCA